MVFICSDRGSAGGQREGARRGELNPAARGGHRVSGIAEVEAESIDPTVHVLVTPDIHGGGGGGLNSWLGFIAPGSISTFRMSP